jgi:hypothetical protein
MVRLGSGDLKDLQEKRVLDLSYFAEGLVVLTPGALNVPQFQLSIPVQPGARYSNEQYYGLHQACRIRMVLHWKII